jgi:rubrerythrin
MDTLTAAEVQALHEALDDEYHAWASYDQVISDFGPVRPFVPIREAEARHAQALSDLFVRYGLPVPANTWRGRVARHASLQAACEAALAAEVANAGMYERLLAATQRPDILAVLRRLQQASQQRHLPAVQRCAQRGADGCGSGRMRWRAPL